MTVNLVPNSGDWHQKVKTSLVLNRAVGRLDLQSSWFFCTLNMSEPTLSLSLSAIADQTDFLENRLDTPLEPSTNAAVGEDKFCGATNNEIQSAGAIQPEGAVYTIYTAEYELTLPASSRGQLTTVEGLVRDVVADLSMDQPLRRI
ncbi:hypothetical protein DFH08DRAFT_1075774 [Mycena albidolilacea]|uniref:ZPR1 jelly-roll domain-containing protein n=1 Tax=Mycena albidolilacea TaxID=1033008 RepID=A0AAD7EYW0_9AGAR|nr:hypothetical protein DFH08DRAFT_1075774 [Mycena albidolilacea]